jgi:toxin ParE1/3/4
MRLRYTRRATRHLNAIADYIAEENPAAAKQVGARIQGTLILLTEFPGMGRDGVLGGTRELIVPGLPYVIVYRVAPEEVVILGVYHGAQLRPGQSEL